MSRKGTAPQRLRVASKTTFSAHEVGGTPVQIEKEFETMGGSKGGPLPEDLQGKIQNGINL